MYSNLRVCVRVIFIACRYTHTTVVGLWRLAGFAYVLILQGCASDLASLPEASFSSRLPATPRAVLEDSVLQPARTSLSEIKGSSIDGVPVEFLEVGQLAHGALDVEGTDYSGSRRGVSPQTSAFVPQSRYKNLSDNKFTVEAVSASVPALLFSLASDAQLQMNIHGSLETNATVNLTNQSLEVILNELSEQAGFVWDLTGNDLQIWGGEPYIDTYPVNYLNISRRTQSSVGLATQVGTINATDSTGGGIANSSQTLVENHSEHTFWDSLSVDIAGLLQQQLGEQFKAEFTINKEAGLVTLYASPHTHQRIQRYLKLLHENTQRQVLIEASVVEVALSDSFSAGVDWQVLASGVSGINAVQILAGATEVAVDTVDRIAGPAGIVSLVQQGSQADVSATLSLLEQFGDVRILSRPRIIALNNQSAVLKVVDNRVYFTVNVQRSQVEDRDEIVTETEIHTVPVGLVMNVTPQISEHNTVMLNVRPTLSRILGFVDDPNPELALANVRNGVPEIQVREMESMLQVKSGDVAIIGGLMQESFSDTDAGLPGLSSLPVLGRLFSSQSRERRQTELLIVLRPTVIADAKDSAGSLR